MPMADSNSASVAKTTSSVVRRRVDARGGGILDLLERPHVGDRPVAVDLVPLLRATATPGSTAETRPPRSRRSSGSARLARRRRAARSRRDYWSARRQSRRRLPTGFPGPSCGLPGNDLLDQQPLADWVLVGKVAPLAIDWFWMTPTGEDPLDIVIGQGAASDDLNAEHPEVVGLNPLEACTPADWRDRPVWAPGNQGTACRC